MFRYFGQNNLWPLEAIPRESVLLDPSVLKLLIQCNLLLTKRKAI